MPNSQRWRVTFYTDESGHEPVLDFLQGLDLKTQAGFEWAIEQLRVRNVRATEPLVKHIDGKLWELRRTSSGNIYRIMYFFFTGQEIVFVHGFQKKSQKTPRREIETAMRRMEDFTNRRGDR